MNILVAEDNKFTAIQYKMLLERMGHHVVTTQDGDECVKKYKQSYKKTEFDSLDDPLFEKKFDLVLLDHHMPKKNRCTGSKGNTGKKSRTKNHLCYQLSKMGSRG